MSPNRTEAAIVKCSYLNVGAARLVPGPSPLFAHPGNQVIERFSVEVNRKKGTAQVANIFKRIPTGSGQMDCPTRA
jgi:hypothetical protein